MILPVAILAGGRATRLRPMSEKIPKSLFLVAGRPFIDHQLALLRRNGYTHVVLCIGYLGEMVQTHLGDGSRWSMRIDYVFDDPKLLGTGGALRRALPRLGSAFFVLYGDSYLLCNFGRVEQAFWGSGTRGLMTVFRNDDRWEQSNVVYEGGRVLRYEKHRRAKDMRYIDYGLSALQANALERYEEGAAFDLAELYTTLASEGSLAGFEVEERFYEIGSPAGLADTEQYLSRYSLDETGP